MPLALKLDSLENLPPALREFYTPTEDGDGFTLQTDPPAASLQNVEGLRSTVQKERQTRRELEKQLNELKATFDGVDPAEVQEMRDKLASIQDKQILDDDGVEALLTKRVQAITEAKQREIDTLKRQVEEAKGEAQQSTQRWKHDRIMTTMLTTAQQAGIPTKRLKDVENYIKANTTQFNLDEKGNVILVDDQGDPLPGNDGFTPMQPNEFFEQRKQDMDWWPSSSGGGPHHRDGATGQNVDLSQLKPIDRLAFIRQQRSRA